MKELMPNDLNANKRESGAAAAELEPVKPENSPVSTEEDAAVENLKKEMGLASANEYNKVLGEVEGFKNVNEIRKELKDKIKDLEDRQAAYQSFTMLARSDSGLGELGGFNRGQANIDKYPGAKEILQKIAEIKKKNSVGMKFWKKPEVDDYEAQVITNYLTTGSMGNFTNPNAEARANEILQKYLAENKNAGAEQENEKPMPANLAEAIFAGKGGAEFTAELTKLKSDLAEIESGMEKKQ